MTGSAKSFSTVSQSMSINHPSGSGSQGGSKGPPGGGGSSSGPHGPSGPSSSHHSHSSTASSSSAGLPPGTCRCPYSTGGTSLYAKGTDTASSPYTFSYGMGNTDGDPCEFATSSALELASLSLQYSASIDACIWLLGVINGRDGGTTGYRLASEGPIGGYTIISSPTTVTALSVSGSP